VRLYYWLGEVLFWLGRHVERRHIGEKGATLLGEQTQSVGSALMNSLLETTRGGAEFTDRNARFLQRLTYSEELRPAYHHLVTRYLGASDFVKAEKWLQAFAEQTQRHHDLRGLGETEFLAGQLCRAKNDLRGALAAYERGLETFTRVGDPERRSWCLVGAALTRLELGEHPENLDGLAEGLSKMNAHRFLIALNHIEDAYDEPDAFRSFCRRFQEQYPESPHARLPQWWLEPAGPDARLRMPALQEALATGLAPEWRWHDPEGDSAFTARNGLEIQAAPGRDLWPVNMTAPRLLRPVAGDFAAETVCLPVSPEKPCVGGLLLWKDAGHFIRLERGLRGEHEVNLQRCYQGAMGTIGRGRLASERVFLRLERTGSQVTALCSRDGMEWLRVGQVEFPVQDPVQIGFHALGTGHARAALEGTAIRFEQFTLLQPSLSAL
jgi:hypothetical protein